MKTFVLRSEKIFLGVIVAILLFIYLPVFIGAHYVRLHQISHGIEANEAVPSIGSDSFQYETAAQNLLSHGTFSLDTKAPFHPDTFRTIGFPLFVAMFLFLGVPFSFFPIVQILIVGCSAYCTYVIGRGFASSRIGMVAGILYLIDPTTILHSQIIMSDILFVFLLLVGVYLLFFSRCKGIYFPALVGVIFGFATLVRPIGVYLFPILLLMYLIQKRKSASWRVLISFCLVSITLYALLITPWVLRNHEVSGVYGLSSVKAYNLYTDYVPEFLAYKNNSTVADARVLEAEGMGLLDATSLSYAPKIQARAMSFIYADPLGYTKFHLTKTIPFFVSSGVEHWFFTLNNIRGKTYFPVTDSNLSTLLLHGNIQALVKALIANPVVSTEQFLWGIVFFLTILAAIFSFKKKKTFYVFLMLGIILYFAILTGPVAYARYRLPAAPFLFLLSLWSVSVVFNWLRQKRYTSAR